MGQFRPLLGGSGSVPTVPPGVLQEARDVHVAVRTRFLALLGMTVLPAFPRSPS
jgi:hypothetical protein